MTKWKKTNCGRWVDREIQRCGCQRESGDTIRKEDNNRARQAFNWNFQDTRCRGRPKRKWRHNVLDEAERTGNSWKPLKDQQKTAESGIKDDYEFSCHLPW